MSQFYEHCWSVESSTNLALIQLPVGGKLNLNGDLANQVTGVASLIKAGFVRKIILEFTGDCTALTFTITGSQNGVPLVEQIVGVVDDVEFSAHYYDIITSITYTGVVANNMQVSCYTDATDGYFPIILLNTEKRISNMAYALNFITQDAPDGCSYTIYESLQNISNSALTYKQAISDKLFSEKDTFDSISQTLQMTDVATNLLVKVTPAYRATSTLRMQFLQL
jgi:hypothetical protein